MYAPRGPSVTMSIRSLRIQPRRGDAPMRKSFALLTVMAMSSLASNAEAGFLGKGMSATYMTPDLATVYPFASFSPATFTVTDDPGFETIGIVEGVTSLPVQFTDDTLTIQLSSTLPPGLPIVSP